MFYIHQTACISPQQTFADINLHIMHEPLQNRLLAIEPTYSDIPPGILRRMGKSVRMGVGTAMKILQNVPQPDGIIIGSANGGKEDCVKFLNQIIDYDEGMLTPINFVQSTPNAVAAQIGLLTHNHGYNITHLHLGLAFEYAAIDAAMLLHEKPGNSYLLGAVDDISVYHYIFEDKQGWYKKESASNNDLYNNTSPGSIAGEAAAMFLVNGNATDAIAKVLAVDTLHHTEEAVVLEKMASFLAENFSPGEKPDLFLTGENGDSRLWHYYTHCEDLLGGGVTVARFKHFCGEFPSATAVGVWLACHFLQQQYIPAHFLKKEGATLYKKILIYNTYKGEQHSFMLIEAPL